MSQYTLTEPSEFQRAELDLEAWLTFLATSDPGETFIALDFETYSECDIRVHGLDRYVSDPSTIVTVMSARMGKVDDLLDSTGSATLTRSLKLSLVDYLHCFTSKSFEDNVEHYHRALRKLFKELPKNITWYAHNAQFEKAILQSKLSVEVDYIHDTALFSRIMGGSSSLEKAARQFTTSQKLDTGRALIQKFAIPQRDGSCVLRNYANWDSSTNHDWRDFETYCDRDVLVTLQLIRAFDGYRHDTHFDLATARMNERGWPVDMRLVESMQTLYLENLETLMADFSQLCMTRGLGTAPNFNSPKQLKEFCKKLGLDAGSFDELHVAKYLKELEHRNRGFEYHDWSRNDQVLYELLKTKRELGGSALKKLQTIKDMVGSDDRLRYQYVTSGAVQTQRTTGKGVQLQNLKRLGANIARVEDLYDWDDPERAPYFDFSFWGNDELARNLRQVFKAPGDGRIVVTDLSSIESRALAALAGEQWKVQGFEAGKDMYKVQASKMYGVDYDDITKQQRQSGKVGELSCGYGAGAGAVRRFAEKMSIEMSESEASKLVSDWREANGRIVNLWAQLEDALLHALTAGPGHRAPGAPLRLARGRVAVEFRDMGSRTPASVKQVSQKAASIEMLITMVNALGGSVIRRARVFHGVEIRSNPYTGRSEITYMKPNELQTAQYAWTNRWHKDGRSGHYTLYGGKLTGILVQSFCREVFASALVKLDQELLSCSNAWIIGQFHDEIAIEWQPPQDPNAQSPFEYSLDALMDVVQRVMTQTSPVALSVTRMGLPLGATVDQAPRYIK